MIVSAALDLVNEIGLDDFTTRRLGNVLGVEGPALYRHFPSKASLLDEMAGAILFPVLRQPYPGEAWDTWLRSVALSSSEQVMGHRDGARIVAQALPIDPLDLISNPLRAAGFSDEDALFASKMITRFMVGWNLHEDSEQRRDDRPIEVYDHAEALNFALDMMISGLRMRLARTMSAAP